MNGETTRTEATEAEALRDVRGVGQPIRERGRSLGAGDLHDVPGDRPGLTAETARELTDRAKERLSRTPAADLTAEELEAQLRAVFDLGDPAPAPADTVGAAANFCAPCGSWRGRGACQHLITIPTRRSA